MDFLKKNYEKVLLGVVLLGLTVAVAILPMIISRTKQKVEDAANNQFNANPKPLPALETKLEDDALKKVQSAYRLDFTSQHNLFNPVTWQKTPDGRLIKIQSGNELGAGALVVTAIKPLYLKLTYKSANANGVSNAYFVTIEDQAASAAKRTPHETIISKESKGEFSLIDVKGPADKPTALNLETKDSGEKIALATDHPYQRINGYSADLKYPPEAGWIRNNQRVDSPLVFGGAQYKIVAITQSNVVVSAKSNDKKTTITFNPPTESR